MFKLGRKVKEFRATAREFLKIAKIPLTESAEKHYKNGFLKLPEKEQRRILARLGVKTEIIIDLMVDLRSYLDSITRKRRPIGRKNEEKLLNALQRVERLTTKTLIEMGGIFSPKSVELAKKYEGSVKTPYPLDEIHRVLLLKGGSQRDKIMRLVQALKEQGVLSQHFKPPWEA